MFYKKNPQKLKTTKSRHHSHSAIKIYGNKNSNSFKNRKIMDKIKSKNIFQFQKNLGYSQNNIGVEYGSNPQTDDKDNLRSSTDSPVKNLMPKICCYNTQNIFQ